MAPIVLNTLDMPTAAIQGVIAKTKTVLKVFLEKVRATRASPTIYVTHISLLNFEWCSMDGYFTSLYASNIYVNITP